MHLASCTAGRMEKAKGTARGGLADRLKKVLGWWRRWDPGWQWKLDCRDPRPDNQIND